MSYNVVICIWHCCISLPVVCVSLLALQAWQVSQLLTCPSCILFCATVVIHCISSLEARLLWNTLLSWSWISLRIIVCLVICGCWSDSLVPWMFWYYFREELLKIIDETKSKITGQWVWAVLYQYIFLPEMEMGGSFTW